MQPELTYSIRSFQNKSHLLKHLLLVTFDCILIRLFPAPPETCRTMDPVGVASTGGNKCRVNKKNRDGHKRLLRRKTADQPPTMQSKDKHGPKKIAEEWERNTAWPSSKKPPQAARPSQQKTNDSGNTLRFKCCQCGDSLEYVPKDLVRHFEEKHRGSPPVFSCHMCTFSTHEFSYLQVHLLSHKDTFSGCSICKDNVQRTWPEFSAHLTMCHCQNGKYSCETCPKFSTGNVGVYLEHMYAHSLAPEGASNDLHTKDRSKFGVRTGCQTLHCQHCGHETSRKLFNKDIKAVHVCPNGNRRKMKKEEGVHSVAMKPNDPVPKIKPRLTRSAVREMCWLTQDCLSLPGREFLDKYCHLSDPQTTLEETQQFLMKSVAGETANQKWTKALKSVLSNVPQDVMSENDLVSNSSDLTVLTVKNKITVAQNGAKYAKKLKMMTSSEKEAVSPGNVPGDAPGVVAQDECQSNLNDHGSCPQAETKLHTESSLPGQSVPSECAQIQENRENRDLKTDQEMEERSKNHAKPAREDGIDISHELKLSGSKEQPFIQKDAPKNRRRRNRRRKRKARSKRAEKRSAGLPLKIVLKKNPVKEKQWVSQSSLPPSRGGPTDEGHEETPQILPNVLQTETHQKKWTKASKTDLSDPTEAVGSIPPLKPGGVTASGASKPAGLENNERGEGAERSLQLLETDADMSESAGRTGQSDPGTAVKSETEKIQLQTPGSTVTCRAPDNQGSSAADGAAVLPTYSKSSPVSQPVITPQGKTANYSFYTDIMRIYCFSQHTFELCSEYFFTALCCR